MRVRFAPSPTGALHIGGARTALFNWLMARHAGGTLVLRIEDTDRERSTPENVAQILDALSWLELDWDEGPLLQSERAQRHGEVLSALLESGRAYRSSAGAQEVRAYKERHGHERGFRGQDEGAGAVRLRVPDEGETVVADLVLGDVATAHRHLDDPVIARADGSVLYNFAVAVDDLDARITHVVRGNDHLSNTAKQLLVMEALEADPPRYAHLPLLHGPDGKKLSKRHGAASVQELREAGYLPEAVRNYLALLGWGADDDATMLSTDELVARFDISRVSRNPARFDEQKLRWLNGRYLRAMDLQTLTERLEGLTGRGGLGPAAAIAQEKLQTLADFWPLVAGLLERRPIDPAAGERWLGEPSRVILADVRQALEQAQPFDRSEIQTALAGVIEARAAKPREVYQPLRVALTGTPVSPGIFESVELLGREETLSRLDAALASPI